VARLARVLINELFSLVFGCALKKQEIGAWSEIRRPGPA
jgi:hypothetical protein